jgi:hypothetical protein
MYHTPLGPAALTGIAGAGGLAALTPLGLIWAILASFAILGAVLAVLRIGPAAVIEAPRRFFVREATLTPRN